MSLLLLFSSIASDIIVEDPIDVLHSDINISEQDIFTGYKANGTIFLAHEYLSNVFTGHKQKGNIESE